SAGAAPITRSGGSRAGAAQAAAHVDGADGVADRNVAAREQVDASPLSAECAGKGADAVGRVAAPRADSTSDEDVAAQSRNDSRRTAGGRDRHAAGAQGSIAADVADSDAVTQEIDASAVGRYVAEAGTRGDAAVAARSERRRIVGPQSDVRPVDDDVAAQVDVVAGLRG